MAAVFDKYKKEVVPKLMDEFKYSSSMEVPKLAKITINIGVGDATVNAKALEKVVEELTKITGRKPYLTRARKSISNFKLRKGMPIGCKVTLRRDAMYEFFDRLVNIAIPRIRDFRGVNTNSFDGRGNYNLGLTEQLIFPEIEMDKVEKVRGMNITFSTTARTDEESKRLLTELGMPFRK
jgi:large subunit ribosomal protein L5